MRRIGLDERLYPARMQATKQSCLPHGHWIPMALICAGIGFRKTVEWQMRFAGFEPWNAERKNYEVLSITIAYPAWIDRHIERRICLHSSGNQHGKVLRAQGVGDLAAGHQ